MKTRCIRLVLVGAVISVAVLGCARTAPPSHSFKTDSKPATTIRGKASYYGDGFHGRKTASGEIFNAKQLTAAHRSLPFGTRLRVKNLENGRSVTVTINDRGPKVKGRVLDLSEGAAKQLGLQHDGVADIEAEIVN